jgi:hypothetical protein
VRFELHDEDSIGGGLCNISIQTLNVELKEPADLAASVLNGHLARQVVAMQGSKKPGCIVCLGIGPGCLWISPQVNQAWLQGQRPGRC